jgi:NTP pyrophosphatase (non-canonical NTP hydrolase)
MDRPSVLQLLSARQIAAHGVDRYPTVQLNLIKLMSEVGELADEILKNGPRERVLAELSDVALCLGALANKLKVDNLTELVAD